MFLDIFIIIVLVWAGYSGWRNGFLKEIISTAGLFIGLLVAALLYNVLDDYLAVEGSQVNAVTSVVAFFILWIIVPIVLGFVATQLTKALKGMQLGLPNSLLGLAVSVIKYLVLMSCVFNMLTALTLMNEERTKNSRLYKPVNSVLSVAFNGIKAEYEERTKPDTIWINVNNDATTKNKKGI